CNEIIAFRNSFHGRTYGSASVTEKRMSQPFFGPYIEGVHFATFNDLSSVKALVSDKTAAIIVEPVQGEGGLTPADPAFLKGLRKLCDEKNICLIFDEVQTGFGRLGTFNSYEAFKVEPDLAAWAKGMGGGFPVGAMAAKRKFGSAIVVGTHGTTYGGNPLACAVAATVVKQILKRGFLSNVRKVSGVLFDGLKQIQRESNKITEIRGMGLMIGVDTNTNCGDLLKALQKNGLMATKAGQNTLRLTPPLILKEEQAHEALGIIGKTLKEMD
ncbi:MAG: aspartate aminotransferase family protein, partial [Alphaproteobacteria bacterium]|nr:aspartate aminotransferase family protein [Alphaproteobacteria bacterium]